MSDTCFLYAIYRKETPNKKYYGITKNIKQRWKKHKHSGSKCTKLKNFIQKHGADNFHHRMIFRGTRQRCLELEQYFISRYDTMNSGYNLTAGGEQNKIISEETRKKISNTMKGKRCGQEHPMFGKQHSEESKRKMSESLKGMFSGSKNPMYGKNPSGFKAHNCKLTYVEIHEMCTIISLKKEGKINITNVNISEYFNVSVGTVKNIINGSQWKNISQLYF